MSKTDSVSTHFANQIHILFVVLRQERIADMRPVLMP